MTLILVIHHLCSLPLVNKTGDHTRYTHLDLCAEKRPDPCIILLFFCYNDKMVSVGKLLDGRAYRCTKKRKRRSEIKDRLSRNTSLSLFSLSGEESGKKVLVT
jgi:hypothetical protein